MHLREATPGDAGRIAEIHVVSAQVAYRGYLPDAFLAGRRVEWWQSKWTDVLNDPSDDVFVLEEPAQHIVGFAYHAASRDEDALPDTGELYSMYIDPDHWGRGYGQSLLDAVLKRSAGRGFRRLTLWVFVWNERARRFYKPKQGGRMSRESKYFTLTLASLRALGSWAADCAERALPVYEKQAGSDSRPRAAIEGIRVFAGGGRRTAQLRSLALSAYSAAREADDPAAAAAARAAGLAASSAYTHPLADVQQTKHIVGPAAYAALALELDHAGDPSIGDGEVRWAIEHVTSEVREVLLQMPARQAGSSRLDTLLYKLDAGIRGRTLPQDA